MPPINSTNIDDNKEHSLSGFPFDLLALIVPPGLIFLMILYLCISTEINKCKKKYFYRVSRRRNSDTESVSSFGSDIHFPAVYKEPEIPKHKTNRFFVKEMKFIIIEDSTKFNDICSICICPFENEDKVIKFNCLHMFHIDCIQPWLVSQLDNNKTPFCPMCKNELEIEYRD